MIEAKFGYFIVDLILMLIWLLVFWFRKDLRKEIFQVSLLFGVLTFIFAPIFLRDYWNPITLFNTIFTLEDLMFGFFTGGISATLYELILGKKLAKRRFKKKNWKYLLIPMVAFNLITFLVLVFVFDISSIYAHIITLLALSFLFVLFRHDLFWDAVLSGLLFGLIYFIVFSIFLLIYPNGIEMYWQVKKLSPFLIFGIPSSELLWAFAWGTVGGPFYEFFLNFRLKDKKGLF